MNLLAQDLNAIQSAGLPGNKVPSTVGATIQLIIPWIFYGSAFLLLIYMLLGGLQLMLSRGDPKAVAGAWGKITNAVIGFMIVFLAYFITTLLGQVFGITYFQVIFGGGAGPIRGGL